MRLLLLLSLIALAAALPAFGCGCDDSLAYGLSISVTAQATGQPVCTATVTAVDGDHQEKLDRVGTAAGPCTYVGAPEREGTYEIRVAADGFATRTVEDVVVPGGMCHVDGEARTIALAP